jgi:trehalose-phosphatase
MDKYKFKAVIFDLDGIVTKTAAVHAQAWKEAFDEYLRLRQERDGETFKEFSQDKDYLVYVDGKPRYEGVDSFLKSRGIEIPYGDPKDTPDAETVCGIGNKKNLKFREVLKEKKPQIYDSSVKFIKSLKSAGIKVGVASSSKNCRFILKSAGLEDLFETRVDGEVSVELGLKGKPEPDIFVKAARNLNCYPKDSVVVEDATSGVTAGRNGNFGFVLGVSRKDNIKDLLISGADIVVKDLSFVDIDVVQKWFDKKPRPLFSDWDRKQEVSDIFQEESRVKKENLHINPLYYQKPKDIFNKDKKPVFFLDYDGTLTPIVDRPDKAIMAEDMRETLKRLSDKFTVAIVSGRERSDVENLVGIKGLFFAGSHGFDISGLGISMIQPEVKSVVPVIKNVIEKVSKELGSIKGLLIEDKKFSLAVHYRLVEPEYYEKIKGLVEECVDKNDNLRLMSGKKVFEILPDVEWDKGKAVRFIMEALSLSWQDNSVVYIGDDTTDEDAFRVVRGRGTAVLVSDQERESPADFQLSCPEETKQLFEKVLADSN